MHCMLHTQDILTQHAFMRRRVQQRRSPAKAAARPPRSELRRTRSAT